jgi:Cysteine rich repeat
MQLGRRVSLVAAIALVLSIPLIGSALAQTNVAKKAIAKAEMVVKQLASSCRPDIKSYCPKVTPGEGRMALCMMAHEDLISDKCYGAMFDAAEGLDLAISNVRRAADACKADIDKVCGTVEPGDGRIAQCLIDNKAKLASTCRAEVVGFQARIKK